MSRRLVIIGLDAADHDVTRELFARGELPRLAGVGERGCFSRLGSTIPPQTAPAWTTITTGVNPGRHGIYYFHNFSTSPITITNSTNTSTPRLWDYVGALGGRSVVVNVPVTYPAQDVRGALVAGIPPWYFDEKSVSPPGLLATLKEAGYEIDAPMSRGLERQPEALVSRAIATEERRVQVFLDLLGQGEWSFGMVVMTALDRLQHKLVGKGEREAEAVRRAYSEVDRLVGKVLDALGPDVDYIVVSDHGYNPRPVAFYPNSWLRARGLLKTRSSLGNRLTAVGHDVFDGHLLWLPQGLTKRFQGAATAVHTIDAVDLEGSRAFVPGTDGLMVVKSKEDQDAIVSGLSALRDDSGAEVCKVYTRDQVYHGERLDASPELLLVPRDDINIKTDPFSPSVLSREGSFPKGNHSSNGIFLAAGPGVKPSTGVQLSIEDVAPTALELMGIQPPGSMDGKAAEGILVRPEGSRDLRPVSTVTGERAHSFTESEEKQVMENLKRLGYA